MADFEQQNTTIKPDQILEIIIGYKWLILLPLCISLTVGVIVSFVTEKTYEASTTILIQPQRVPTQYVQSIVSSDLDQRLNTISQQILSRSNLEKIIDQFGLFANSEGMYLEDKILSMRSRVNVKIDKNRSRRDTGSQVFYISFKGGKPERVMRVANTLASYFMDENLKVREAQAVGTSEFLESELSKIEQILEEKEKTLSEYRSKHIGGLPDELESNLRTLDRFQVQLSDRQNALSDLKNTISVLNSQISRTEDIMAGSASGDLQTGDSKTNKSELERLYETETIKLDDLLSKYTKKHPDIIKLTKSVETLKQKIIEENGGGDDSNNQVKKNNPVTKAENFLFEKQLHIRKINNDIKKIESEIMQIQSSMAIYQKKVENTPKREQELQSLLRDYNNISENYNSLLARKLESEIAVNMEKKQKGEQFKILDYARLPEKPISPDIKIFLLISLAVGLGIGGGITFLIEFLDTSIKSAEQIESEFGLPILASIPSLKIPGKKSKTRMEYFFISLFVLYAITILSFFIIINRYGVDRVSNFIKMQLNM